MTVKNGLSPVTDLIGEVAVKRILETGEISDDEFAKLYEFYWLEMPYGTQKARTGDPSQFIYDQLSQSEGVKNG